MTKTRDNRNCPYCLSPVEPQEERIRCPNCGVVHHADCWKANGKCSVYGCDGWAVWSSQIADRIAPDAGTAVDVSAGKGAVKVDAPKCIRCGAPVKEGQIECMSCQYHQFRHRNHWFDNCSGPAILCLGVIGTVTTLIVKALT